MMNLTAKLDWLIDQWCERRELRPLQFLFRAYPGVLVHTDQYGELLEALRDVKGLCRDKLRPDELTVVISLVNELEEFIQRRLRS